MEMKKRSGICTEEVFWECVEEIGWGDEETPDTNKVKRACLLSWSPEFGSSFWEILSKKESEVGTRLSNFEYKGDEEVYYLGSDGFGDFCSHVVGRGKKVFDEEMDNPRKLFERARDCKFQEKFAYCIPYEAHPDTTWERWMEMHAPGGTTDLKEWEREWEAGGYGYSDETFEDHLERSRRQHRDYQLGDWAYLDSGHYVPLSIRYRNKSAAFLAELSSLESLTSEEQNALDFATLLMHYFGALSEEKTDVALGASEEALRAWWGLHYIDNKLGALRRAHAELLPMSGGIYGGENTINDHRIYMGGLEGFPCRKHYNDLVREI